MTWFDEAVARRQRELRAAESAQKQHSSRIVEPVERQKQEVEAFDPLVQRLLSEYGERLYGKGLIQKRFIIRLLRPGKSPTRSWDWYWHLYSLVKGKASIELHPAFDEEGIISGWTIMSGQKRVEIVGADEDALKEGLVALYLQ